jgi:DNA-binding response OmpR family regulator
MFNGSAEITSQIMAARILVVDEDFAMQRTIINYLTEHDLCASAVRGRKTLLHSVAVREPDLIILELRLGEDDGLDVLRELRTKSAVPVILITESRREEIDRVVGLELGADDYMIKPLGLRELLARVRAVLRRRSMDRLSPARQRERIYRFAGWCFDQRQRALISPDEAVIALTKGEYALLSAFVQAPRRTLTREHLLQATRVHEDVYDRSIDVQILRLRRKLGENAHAPRLVHTERGVGYRFDADVEIL